MGDVDGSEIRAFGLDAECEHFAAKVAQGVHGVGIVHIGDYAAVIRHEQGELSEGMFYIVKVLEKIEVIGLDIEDYRYCRKKVEK
ncbi:hypothetical protein SDC9_143632 [bioreactor metagenome]|uniref:Uncharacterized protein n=1 Tax=bioreactor metagenome TaxID=1076179 RepID=A0A645E4J9_9ZZZZ